jgi:UDP-2-acetamido-3-amino-2,3-dideoxy-glucuronate N-acetyltransferase
LIERSILHYEDLRVFEKAYPGVAAEVPVAVGLHTNIWPGASIGTGAAIGDHCTLGRNAHIGPGVIVSNGCKIQNGAQLFAGVTLADGVFVGPGAVFTNVRRPRAFQRGTFATITVGKGATIGANATICSGIHIGEYAMVGAGAVLTRSIGAHQLWAGVPAEYLRHVCACGAPLGYDRTRDDTDFQCNACSEAG